MNNNLKNDESDYEYISDYTVIAPDAYQSDKFYYPDDNESDCEYSEVSDEYIDYEELYFRIKSCDIYDDEYEKIEKKLSKGYRKIDFYTCDDYEIDKSNGAIRFKTMYEKKKLRK